MRRRAFRLPGGRRAAEREVDDEIAFHLAMRAERLRARGDLTDTGAARRAHERFGDVAAVRAATLREDRPRLARERVAALLGDLAQDARVAARALRRAPGFAAVAVLTLALGIGAATAIGSVAWGVLGRPLPFADPERLVQVTVTYPAATGLDPYLSGPEVLDLRDAAPSLALTAAIGQGQRTLGGDGAPERLLVGSVSASLFPLLGVPMLHGRPFGAAEDRRGDDAVVVLSHGLWERRFGGDPAVVGRTVQLDGRARTVLGVLPASARLGELEAFVPLALDPASPGGRGAHRFQVLGRLAPGATVERAGAELAAYAARVLAAHPDDYGDPGFTMGARPLREALVGDARPVLLVLLGAVALLLLLACINVTNLLLVRAEARQRELGVRVALGAGRGRLVRQLLAETLCLATAGALVGLPLAVLGVRGLLALNPGVVPAGTTVAVDGAVLLASAATVALATLLAGLAPAVQAGRVDVRTAIASGAVGGGRRGLRLRGALVASEVALAVLVLVGAGLVGRSFWRLQRVDPGFRYADVLTFDLRLPPQRPAEPAQVAAAFGRVLDALRATPGVRAAAAVSHLPMGGLVGDWSIDVEGRPVARGEATPSPSFAVASAGYFDAIGIPLLAGRDFGADDPDAGAPAVIVSRSLAALLWPDADAVGRRFRLQGGDPPNPWMTVVGVVGDVRAAGLGAPPRETYYLLDRQFPHLVGGAPRDLAIVVRAHGEPAALAGAVRDAVTALEPDVAVAKLRPLRDVVQATATRERFAAALLALFGGAALLLAVVGVYGVLAYTVTRRRREMGIRLALGARPAQVRALVVRTGLGLTVAGLAAGLAVALAATRLLDAVLYDVSATDPATFAGAALVLAAAALAASHLPARRATRVDPAEALRPE